LQRERRRIKLTVLAKSRVARREFATEYFFRPAIGDDVMKGAKQDVLPRRYFE
jgi:hypothetical protein